MNRAKIEEKRICAIGTTAMRAMETSSKSIDACNELGLAMYTTRIGTSKGADVAVVR